MNGPPGHLRKGRAMVGVRASFVPWGRLSFFWSLRARNLRDLWWAAWSVAEVTATRTSRTSPLAILAGAAGGSLI